MRALEGVLRRDGVLQALERLARAGETFALVDELGEVLWGERAVSHGLHPLDGLGAEGLLSLSCEPGSTLLIASVSEVLRAASRADELGRAHLEQIDTLHQLTMRLGSVADLEQAASAIIDAATSVFEETQVILLWRERESPLAEVLAASWTMPPRALAQLKQARSMFEHDEPASYTREEPGAYPWLFDACESAASVALRVRDSVDALVVLTSSAPRAFDVGDLKSMTMLAAQGERALQHVLQTNELRVHRDHLEELIGKRTKSLHQAIDDLTQAAQLHEDVQMIMRHDLKGPLTSVIGLPRVILRQEHSLSADGRSSLSMIERAGRRVLAMINQSLDIFKIERGNYQTDPQDFELIDVLEDVIEDQLTDAGSRGIEVELEGVPTAPVAGEESLCYSLFANLLKNALEASSSGDLVRVRVNLDEDVRVTIHNRAVVPDHVQERFFEKFSTSKSGGTGLGTYSAKIMTEVQGGRISMLSSFDYGTTLTVNLPCAGQARVPTLELEPVRDPFAGSRVPRLTQLSVLLADDDPFCRAMLERHILALGLTFESVADGEQAVEAFELGRFDLAILDGQMPGLDGFEAAREIRQAERRSNRPPAPLVIFTGHTRAQIEDRALDAGFNSILTKPASLAQIGLVISELFPTKHLDFELDVTRDHQLTTMPMESGAFDASPIVIKADPDMLDLIAEFLEEKIDESAEWMTAFESQNFEELRRFGHRLRGTASMYGLEQLSELGHDLEVWSQEHNADLVEKTIHELMRFLFLVRPEL